MGKSRKRKDNDSDNESTKNGESSKQHLPILHQITQFLPFTGGKDDFEIWYERFEQWLLANKVEASREVSLFLTLLSNDTSA